jgi:hypothetical protein
MIGRRYAGQWDESREEVDDMASLVFPSMVRDQVLEQHATLRTLLQSALDHVDRWSSAAGEHRGARLGAIGRELCDQIRAHLLFEDEALAPVVAVLDTWGPERVRELHREHARQREELDDLEAIFETSADPDQIAAAVTALAEDITRDMAGEEEGCLSAAGMCAGILPIT